MVKVVAVFVVGVVLALGSALIYLRVSDMVHAEPAAQATVIPAPSPPTELAAVRNDTASAVAADDQPLEPEPIEPKKPKLKPAVEIHRQVAKTVIRKEQPKRPVIAMAQNTPPPPLLPAPADPVPVLAPDPALDAPQSQDTPAPAPARQPHVVTLESGTSLIVRLGETLSTDHNYTGDTFRAALESPIIMDGFIIADKGSKVLGRVVNAQKAGRMQGLANLTLALTEINTTDGQRVRIESSTYDKKGPQSTGEDAAKIAGGAALGAIIGAIAGGGRGAAIGAGAGGAAGTGTVLATRGKPAVLPTETRLTFRLATPVTLTEKLNF